VANFTVTTHDNLLLKNDFFKFFKAEWLYFTFLYNSYSSDVEVGDDSGLLVICVAQRTDLTCVDGECSPKYSVDDAEADKQRGGR